MDHAEITDQAILEFEHQTDLSLQDVERIGSELHARGIMYDTYYDVEGIPDMVIRQLKQETK